MIYRSFRQVIQAAFASLMFACMGIVTFAQSDAPNDLKPASILVFNKYTSNQSSPQSHDTQINITNTSRDASINLHMFMVDGSSCSVADFFLSLTQNQTASFLASDFDPGVEGYIFAVAVGGGAPTQFNYLIGDELIRESDGKLANLQAVGFARNTPLDVVPNGDGTASLIFNGAEYDRMPSSLGASSFNSQVDHSSSLAIFSPMSNLMVGNPVTTNIFTLVYDDNETPFSTSIAVRCFAQVPLTSLRIAGGNIKNIVPIGRTGWIRLSASTRPLLGAILTKGPVFNGGHNLHPLTLLPTYTIAIPAF